MENNETNDSASKSDYQRVLRPASILLKERDVYVYPGTKRILNWKFSSITEQEFDDKDHQSYLNFNDFNYESFEEVSGWSDCF